MPDAHSSMSQNAYDLTRKRRADGDLFIAVSVRIKRFPGERCYRFDLCFGNCTGFVSQACSHPKRIFSAEIAAQPMISAD
jgi:hypothetical protein